VWRSNNFSQGEIAAASIQSFLHFQYLSVIGIRVLRCGDKSGGLLLRTRWPASQCRYRYFCAAVGFQDCQL
jgi:hypothetical protein